MAEEDEGVFAEFSRELKRRRVYKVGAAYLAIGFLVLQGAEVTLQAIGPDWLYRAVVILVLAGFPLTLVLAWLYDLTSHGITRTGASPTEGTGLTLLKGTGIVVSLGFVAAVAWMLLR